MRPFCIECVTKHVGQALVLLMETKKGYPHHFIYAVGHLAEAEDESVEKAPDIAHVIRELRIEIMNGNDIDFDDVANNIMKWRSKYAEST